MPYRARESKSTAEQELLSSTSDDVCEMWSGEDIVRVIGSPGGMKTLVILTDGPITIEPHKKEDATEKKNATTKEDVPETGEALEQEEAMEDEEAMDKGRAAEAGQEATLRWVTDLQEAIDSKVIRNSSRTGFHNQKPSELRQLADAAPNLALNVKSVSSLELRIWAAVAILLQSVALAVPALATYHWRWPKGSNPVADYGYPCFFAGSVLLMSGLVLCGHVIEGVTTEHHFMPVEGKCSYEVVRLQRACTVGDQHFKSFALFNPPGDPSIKTSRMNNRDFR